MAKRDHDVVFFLGDYIYEFGIDRGIRPDSNEPYITQQTVTLDEYRTRYAAYKLDPDLQRAHAVAPWIVTLDDHEVVDNWADEAHPSAPPAQFLVRRANAFRAYWEHMPLRLAQLPKGPDMQLYRRLQYGRLAEFSVLDTRQYRSDQAYGDGTKAPGPETKDPARTITGDAQEKWLLDGWTASRVALERDGPPDRDRTARHQGRPGRTGPDGHLGRLRGLAGPGPRRRRAAQGPQPGLDRRRPAPQRRLGPQARLHRPGVADRRQPSSSVRRSRPGSTAWTSIPAA